MMRAMDEEDRVFSEQEAQGSGHFRWLPNFKADKFHHDISHW
jgi:hypothetical protein